MQAVCKQNKTDNERKINPATRDYGEYMGRERKYAAANDDCCNGTPGDGEQKVPAKFGVTDLQQFSQAQKEIQTVCRGVCEEISTDSPARQ